MAGLKWLAKLHVETQPSNFSPVAINGVVVVTGRHGRVVDERGREVAIGGDVRAELLIRRELHHMQHLNEQLALGGE